MTSRILCAVALLLAAGPASAEEIPSAEARAYYQLKLEDRPEGVYAWDERDLIFVQARVRKGGLKSVEKIESAEMGATRRILRKWIEGKAALRRVDPVFPPGLDLVRRTCRKLQPSLEYAAAWKFADSGCSFSRETADERITATVFRKSVLLESIPQGFVTPLTEEAWLDAMGKLVRTAVRGGDARRVAFACGALDCLGARQTCEAAFPEFGAEDYASRAAAFFDAAMAPLRGTESVSAAEYDDVCGAVSRYLADSPLAGRFRADAVSLVAPLPVRREWCARGRESAVTNVTVRVSTNLLDAARCSTNVAKVVSGVRRDGRAAPLGARYRRETERLERGEEVRVVTETVVREIRSTVGVDGVRDFGVPQFERLFLAGGYLENRAGRRTAAGDAAVGVFYGKASMGERENAILGALRENPSDKELWNLLGRVHSTKDRPYAALVCYRNALRIDPHYDFALTNLAVEYAKLGKRTLACGTAAMVLGLTDEVWCRRQVLDILRREW